MQKLKLQTKIWRKAKGWNGNLKTKIQKLKLQLRIKNPERIVGNFKNLTLIVALLGILITVTLNIWNSYRDFNNKLKVFAATTYYNRGIFNTYMLSIKEEIFEQRNFPIKFNLDIYKNNLDLLGALRGDCINTYLQLIAQMDVANLENDKLWDLYVQEGLIFETNQWKNTKERQEELQNNLKNTLFKLDSLFSSIYENQDCGLRTKNIFRVIVPGL